MRKPKNDRTQFTLYLQDDEHILWRGEPDSARLLKKDDYFVIPFTILWSLINYGLVVHQVTQYGLAGLFCLLSPGVWFAFMLFPMRFINEYRRRKNTAYAITNKRLLTIDHATGELKSSDFSELEQVDYHTHKDKSGTIQFRYKQKIEGEKIEEVNRVHAFNDIPDVTDVLTLIGSLQYEELNIPGDEIAYYETTEKHEGISGGK